MGPGWPTPGPSLAGPDDSEYRDGPVLRSDSDSESNLKRDWVSIPGRARRKVARLPKATVYGPGTDPSRSGWACSESVGEAPQAGFSEGSSYQPGRLGPVTRTRIGSDDSDDAGPLPVGSQLDS